MLKKIIISALGLIVALFLLFTPSGKISFIDVPTDNYFKESISKAGIAYASCRVVNASVSVIQNSTLELEPAGVGVSLAVGQILDPIDDMTERLSDILVTAIVSLGVQKLAYEMSIWFAPFLLAVLLLTYVLFIWFRNNKTKALQQQILRLIFLVIALRLCLPFSSLVNDMVNKHFFEERIETANAALNTGSAELDKLSEFSMPEVDGFIGTIENSAHFLAQKAKEFKKALSKLSENMGSLIDNMLRLTFLYVGLFIIQVIVLPILSFWAITKLANGLFKSNIPMLIKHRELNSKE